MTTRHAGITFAALAAFSSAAIARAQEALPPAVVDETSWLDHGLGPTWTALGIALGAMLIIGLAIVAWTRFGPKGGRKIVRGDA